MGKANARKREALEESSKVLSQLRKDIHRLRRAAMEMRKETTELRIQTRAEHERVKKALAALDEEEDITPAA